MNTENLHLQVALVAIVLIIGVRGVAAQSMWDSFRDHRKGEVAIGVGALHGPACEGSDDHEFDALPLVHVEWNDLVFLDPVAASYASFKNPLCKLDSTVNFRTAQGF